MLFFLVQDLISNIQIKLSKSNGELEGFSTQEEFITAIQASSESRSAGCFLGGAGTKAGPRLTTCTCLGVR